MLTFISFKAGEMEKLNESFNSDSALEYFYMWEESFYFFNCGKKKHKIKFTILTMFKCTASVMLSIFKLFCI